eukprot:g6602.t1
MDSEDKGLDPMARDRRGMRFLMRGEYASAAAEFRGAIALFEKPRMKYAPARVAANLVQCRAVCYHNLGISLQHLPGRSDEAVLAHRRAVELNPQYEAGFYHLACALAELRGDTAGAIAALRQVVALGAKVCPNAYLQLGKLLQQEEDKAGDDDEAKKQEILDTLLRAAQVEPNNPLVHYHLACVWGKRGDLPKATASLHACLALEEVPAARYMLQQFEGIAARMQQGQVAA